MPVNDFLTFAGDPAANVMPQNEYAAAAFTARTLGFVTGTALSVQLNKVWRGSSLITSMIGQFTCDVTGHDMLDDGTPAGLTALKNHFHEAIGIVAKASVPTGNWLPIAGGTLTGPLAIHLSNTWANLGLIRPAGQGAQIVAFTGNAWAAAGTRFDVVVADQTPETGANQGSNFSINRFSDTGGLLGQPIHISRATGRVDFEVAPTVKGDLLPYLPLAGGTLYGPLGVGGTGVMFPGIGWNTHHIAFTYDPPSKLILAAEEGNYVGALATTDWVSAVLSGQHVDFSGYLPITGGTVSNYLNVAGVLVVDGAAGFRSSVFFGNMGDFINFPTGNLRVRQWAADWYDYWDGSSGWRAWVCGPTATSMTLSPTADLSVSGVVTSNAGRLIAVSGSRDASVSVWRSDLGQAFGMWCGNGALWFGSMDGAGNPVNPLFHVDTNGALVPQGVLYSPVGISTPGTIYAAQDMSCGGNSAVAGSLYVTGGGDIGATLWAGVLASHNQADIGGRLDVRGGRIVSISGNNPSVGAWNLADSNCEGFWCGSHQLTFGHLNGDGTPNSPKFAVSDSQYVVMPAILFYANPSDVSLKTNVQDAAVFDSLGAILNTPIVSFDWRSGGHVPFGFTAQDIEANLPDAVVEPDMDAVRGIKYLNDHALMAHLFRAIGQLNDKIARLEETKQ